jgi:hypothetical protein
MTHNMCEKRRTTASNRGRNWRRSCRRRGSAPATTTPGRPAGGLQTDSSGRRSSARRAQTASSRSRSPTAPGHCSASTSTRGQERARRAAPTRARRAAPTRDRAPTRSRSLEAPPQAALRATRGPPRALPTSQSTRAPRQVEQCTSWQRPSSRQGAARKRTASTAQPPPQAE